MGNTNFANRIVIPFSASAVTFTAVEFNTDPGAGNIVELAVESLDASNAITFALEESNDGVTYAALATPVTGNVKPLGKLPAAASVAKFCRLRVSGGYGRVVLSFDAPVQEVNPI